MSKSIKNTRTKHFFKNMIIYESIENWKTLVSYIHYFLLLLLLLLISSYIVSSSIENFLLTLVDYLVIYIENENFRDFVKDDKK